MPPPPLPPPSPRAARNRDSSPPDTPARHTRLAERRARTETPSPTPSLLRRSGRRAARLREARRPPTPARGETPHGGERLLRDVAVLRRKSTRLASLAHVGYSEGEGDGEDWRERTDDERGGEHGVGEGSAERERWEEESKGSERWRSEEGDESEPSSRGVTEPPRRMSTRLHPIEEHVEEPKFPTLPRVLHRVHMDDGAEWHEKAVESTTPARRSSRRSRGRPSSAWERSDVASSRAASEGPSVDGDGQPLSAAPSSSGTGPHRGYRRGGSIRPPSPSVTESMSRMTEAARTLENIDRWRKVDLVMECKRRNLRVGGIKSELRERILADVRNERAEVATRRRRSDLAREETMQVEKGSDDDENGKAGHQVAVVDAGSNPMPGKHTDAGDEPPSTNLTHNSRKEHHKSGDAVTETDSIQARRRGSSPVQSEVEASHLVRNAGSPLDGAGVGVVREEPAGAEGVSDGDASMIPEHVTGTSEDGGATVEGADIGGNVSRKHVSSAYVTMCESTIEEVEVTRIEETTGVPDVAQEADVDETHILDGGPDRVTDEPLVDGDGQDNASLEDRMPDVSGEFQTTVSKEVHIEYVEETAEVRMDVERHEPTDADASTEAKSNQHGDALGMKIVKKSDSFSFRNEHRSTPVREAHPSREEGDDRGAREADAAPYSSDPSNELDVNMCASRGSPSAELPRSDGLLSNANTQTDPLSALGDPKAGGDEASEVDKSDQSNGEKSEDNRTGPSADVPGLDDGNEDTGDEERRVLVSRAELVHPSSLTLGHSAKVTEGTEMTEERESVACARAPDSNDSSRNEEDAEEAARVVGGEPTGRPFANADERATLEPQDLTPEQIAVSSALQPESGGSPRPDSSLEQSGRDRPHRATDSPEKDLRTQRTDDDVGALGPLDEQRQSSSEAPKSTGVVIGAKVDDGGQYSVSGKRRVDTFAKADGEQAGETPIDWENCPPGSENENTVNEKNSHPQDETKDYPSGLRAKSPPAFSESPLPSPRPPIEQSQNFVSAPEEEMLPNVQEVTVSAATVPRTPDVVNSLNNSGPEARDSDCGLVPKISLPTIGHAAGSIPCEVVGTEAELGEFSESPLPEATSGLKFSPEEIGENPSSSNSLRDVGRRGLSDVVEKSPSGDGAGMADDVLHCESSEHSGSMADGVLHGSDDQQSPAEDECPPKGGLGLVGQENGVNSDGEDRRDEAIVRASSDSVDGEDSQSRGSYSSEEQVVQHAVLAGDERKLKSWESDESSGASRSFATSASADDNDVQMDAEQLAGTVPAVNSDVLSISSDEQDLNPARAGGPTQPPLAPPESASSPDDNAASVDEPAQQPSTFPESAPHSGGNAVPSDLGQERRPSGGPHEYPSDSPPHHRADADEQMQGNGSNRFDSMEVDEGALHSDLRVGLDSSTKTIRPNAREQYGVETSGNDRVRGEQVSPSKVVPGQANDSRLTNSNAKASLPYAQTSEEVGMTISPAQPFGPVHTVLPPPKVIRKPEKPSDVLQGTRAALAVLRREEIAVTAMEVPAPNYFFDSQARAIPSADMQKTSSQTSAPVCDLLAPPPSPSVVQNAASLAMLPPRQPVASRSMGSGSRRDNEACGNLSAQHLKQQQHHTRTDGTLLRNEVRDSAHVLDAQEVESGHAISSAAPAREGAVTFLPPPSKKRRLQPPLVPLTPMPTPASTLRDLKPPFPHDSTPGRSGTNRWLDFGNESAAEPNSILEKLTQIEQKQVTPRFAAFRDTIGERRDQTANQSLLHLSSQSLFHTGNVSSSPKVYSKPAARKRATVRMMHAKRGWDAARLAAASRQRAEDMAHRVGAWRVMPSPFQNDGKNRSPRNRDGQTPEPYPVAQNDANTVTRGKRRLY